MIDLKIFTDNIEEKALGQIKELEKYDVFDGAKVRIMPDVHAGKGCVVGFTADLGDRVIPNITGVDVGCLDKDTEFLTRKGWKKISDYSKGDEVMQYDKKTDTASFCYPQRYIKRNSDGFYHFKNSKGLDQMLSSDHKMLIWKGYKRTGYNLMDITPKEMVGMGRILDNGYYGIKTCFNVNNKGLGLSDDEVRLEIMVASDGCIKYRTGDTHQIYLHFRKERKIERAIKILENLSIKYKKSLEKDGSTHIYFKIKTNVNKDLSKFWNASQHELKVLANESLLWDGYKGYRSHFSNTNKDNSDVIQFAFTANNIRTPIYTSVSRKEGHNDCYIVTPTKNQIIGVTNNVIFVKSQDGYEYCFTVESGYFVARRNDKIFITGNCGMLTVKLGNIDLDLKRIDDIINKYIPSGFSVHENIVASYIYLDNVVAPIQNKNRIMRSIGTLGGGNHFVEINVDSGNNKYLVIHSGSRNLGLQIAKHYQNKAIEYCHSKPNRKEIIDRLTAMNKKHLIEKAIIDSNNPYSNIPKELCFLSDKDRKDYLHDMSICQKYARLNREIMARIILSKYFGLSDIFDYNLRFLESGYMYTCDIRKYDFGIFHTVHNYIDFKDNIIRKGAIRANKNELVLIPINMRDGSILAKGKGNPDWNNSAPHGAGRIMSRRKAKEELNIEDFEREMKDVFTTSVCDNTLDEAPMAYKPIDEIIKNIKDTVEIVDILKPIYNYKNKK